MDTALPQKFPFVFDKNLAKANCTENHVCTSCDIVVLCCVYEILVLLRQKYIKKGIFLIYVFRGVD